MKLELKQGHIFLLFFYYKEVNFSANPTDQNKVQSEGSKTPNTSMGTTSYQGIAASGSSVSKKL